MSRPERMEPLDTSADGRAYSPSVARNRAEILAELRRVLPADGRLLELAAGTGEHAAFFAPQLPSLEWQPTDRSETALASIRAWRTASAVPNLREPLALDLESGPWPAGPWDAALAINLLHIAPWSTTEALFAGLAPRLAPTGVLVIYGAFLVPGRPTAPSNLAFDRTLRERDPQLGVRKLDDVTRVAAKHGMRLASVTSMPNNNDLLTWQPGANGPRCQASVRPGF